MSTTAATSKPPTVVATPRTPPVRIVAVGDTHLYHKDLVVPPGDIFVHVGDMCAGGAFAELRTTAEWIMSLPHPHKVVIAGNHDWPFVHSAAEARALFKGAAYLEDSAALVAGVLFYGSPWQPQFFDWAFNLPRGGRGLQVVWSRIPHGIDVLITHGPPKGYGDQCLDGDRAGCEHLLARVRVVKPKLHLFGHIHDDGGKWQDGPTTILNVTTAMGRRAPTVIDFDPMTKQVTLVAVPPRKRAR